MFAREMLKVTFLLSYFCVTKRRVQGGEATSERRRRDGVYQKSARRTCAVLLPNHRRRARVSRASRAWRVRAARGKVVKVGSFAALHGFIYTTRANISHEIAEQICARIVCTPTYKCKAGINTYAEHVCWRRRDGASWIEFVCGRDFQNKPYLAMFTPRLLPLWRRVAQFLTQPSV